MKRILKKSDRKKIVEAYKTLKNNTIKNLIAETGLDFWSVDKAVNEYLKEKSIKAQKQREKDAKAKAEAERRAKLDNPFAEYW